MSENTSDTQQVGIRVTGEADTPIQYANFAKVVVTSLEAVLVFALLDPATIQEDSRGVPEEVEARTIARIALPPSVLGALRRALEQQAEMNPQLSISMSEGSD